MVLLTPCIDYVIVFTRLAGGSDRKLLAAAPSLMLSSTQASAFAIGFIATATPPELPPIARARRAYAPDATPPAESDFRWSSTSSRAVSPSCPSVVHRHSMGTPTPAAPHSPSGL